MFKLDITNTDKLFFTSDTHFGHYNICRYCNRPFETRSEMDNALIDNWNSVVPKDGIVIHCGDFMLPHKNNFLEYEKYLKKLNGKIYLLRGNHDMIDIGEHYIDDSLKLIANDMMMITINGGVKIMAQHYPMLSYPSDYQVFGHIHTLSDGTCHGMAKEIVPLVRKTQYDVGVDQNNYTPISFNDLKEKFQIQ